MKKMWKVFSLILVFVFLSSFSIASADVVGNFSLDGLFSWRKVDGSESIFGPGSVGHVFPPGYQINMYGYMETKPTAIGYGGVRVFMNAYLKDLSGSLLSTKNIINDAYLEFKAGTNVDSVSKPDSGDQIYFTAPTTLGNYKIEFNAEGKFIENNIIIYTDSETNVFNFTVANPSLNATFSPSSLPFEGGTVNVQWQMHNMSGATCEAKDGAVVVASKTTNLGSMNVFSFSVTVAENSSQSRIIECHNSMGQSISTTVVIGTNQVGVDASLNPPIINKGESSKVIYSSVYADSCQIWLNGIKKAEFCPTSGTYFTGYMNYVGNYDYQVTCGAGTSYSGGTPTDCDGPGGSLYSTRESTLASNGYLDKFKIFFKRASDSILPTSFAAQVSDATQILTLIVNQPIPVLDVVPTLSFHPSNIKDLVKKGSSDTIGKTYLDVSINNLPSGQKCYLRDISSLTLDLKTYTSAGIDISKEPENLSQIADTTTFKIYCPNNVESNSVPVSGQSGTLTSSNPICTIPVGGSSCIIPTTWTTTNPQTKPSQVLTYFSGATAPPALSGTDVNTTITPASGSQIPGTVLISTFNKVDKEGNSSTIQNSEANQLAVLATLVKCTLGSSWNGTICAPVDIGVNISANPAGPLAAPGSTNLSWTMSGNPTSCDADGIDWAATNIKNGDAITQRSGMPAKTYTFKIKCFKGALIATDQVEVTVGASLGNQPPIVNAGPDRFVINNGTSVSIANGAATAVDPDGFIEALLWTRTSGPNFPTISNSTTLTPTFSGLVVGTYVFKLQATDNQTAKSSDEMSVVVSSSATGSVPTIIYKDANPIGPHAVTLNLQITSIGSPTTLLEKGTCIGKTLSGLTNCIAQSTSDVPPYTFSHNRTTLEPQTTYYYRGYARNATGTGYTNVGQFTTTGDISVTANPASYTVAPSADIPFTYTTNTTLFPAGLACRLFDYSNAPITNWVDTTGTIIYPAPFNNDFGPYSYHIRCRSKSYNSIVGTSGEIIVTVEDNIVPLAPDLVITDTWPINVYTGATTFFATVVNVGTIGTGGQFKNRFQVSKNSDGSGATSYDTGLMEPLESGGEKTTERSINFPTAGIFYMRACADLPPVVPGGIVESDENNNCGPWAEVNVYDGQPDLVASVPTPSDLYIGNTTFYSRITKFAHFITGSV